MEKDDFEFNYNKEKRKRIVLSDEQTEIIIKFIFFALLVIILMGIGVFFPIYINIYCLIIGALFVIYIAVLALVDVVGSVSLKAFSILLVIGFTCVITNISNKIFMYHNLRNGGKEFIQKIDRSGNYSISIFSIDSKNKRKRFSFDNNDYTIVPINDNKQYLIKQDGKYFLYINNQFSNQIKDIKIVQQESIRQEKINQASPKNEDEEVYFYFLISVVFLLFILFGSKKL